MREALALRPFQREALDALVKRFHEEAMQRLAIILPTGAGKTFCFAHQALEHIKAHPDERVIILVHTDELVEQTVEELLAVAPHLKIGVVKGARNEVDAQVIVASVMSLKNPARRALLLNVTLIIVDEGHHVLAKTYMDIITDLGGFGGRAKVVGYTATLIRGDGQGLGKVWQDVAFKRSIGWMIRKRYLIKARGIAVEVPELDLTRVKGKADFNDADLGDALAEALAPELVAKAYVEHASDRKGILFAPTVASAYLFAEALREAGITADTIHGGLPLGDRDNPAPGTRRYILRAHKAGEFQVLTNCMVLTEGYNDPTISCVVVARPTKSKGLYVQMVGRGLRVDGLRPYDEQDCLILDVVGANTVHDLDPDADLSTRKKREQKEATEAWGLTDLADEFDAGEGVAEDGVDYYEGDIVTREFDPLGNKSTKVWMKSKGGAFFMPAGKDLYVFIMQYPEPGRWSVAWCTTDPKDRWYVCGPEGQPSRECKCAEKCAGRQVAMTEYRGLSLEVAMGWAEDYALDLNEGSLNKTKRNAPWRRKPASDAIKWKARNLGITVDPEARMGALSDQIDSVLGSHRIDPLVAAVNKAAKR